MLNTKEVDAKPTGGFIPKNLQPGNVICKINHIKTIPAVFGGKPGNDLHIVLELEGEDLGASFEGYLIDKDKPELGRYKGQVGTVKASQWSYRDFQPANGDLIERDKEMIRWLKVLCIELGFPNWVDETNDKHNFAKIEDLFVQFEKEQLFKDQWFTFCICGKKYMKQNNFPAYELFLAKPSSLGRAFCKDAAKVQTFNKAVHTIEPKPKDIASFGEGAAKTNQATNNPPKGGEHTEGVHKDFQSQQQNAATGNNNSNDDDLPFTVN